MIKIEDKSHCCGCNACATRCPIQCITLIEDMEGFRYPVIDTSLCINCGVCEKVCPIIHQEEEKKPIESYAIINPDESIRMQSSSGGAFTAIAEQVISEGGVVFGASFDENWEVHHTYTETKSGLSAFRGSKYLQSRIESSYRDAERFLKAGRKVLFSGSPCQIAGLKRYLHKEYDNLIAIDFICHGVPSPKVWRIYLKEKISSIRTEAGEKSVLSSSLNRVPVITGIAFRDKEMTGWKKYSFVIRGKSAFKTDKNLVLLSNILHENIYMQAFLNDLILRPSCHNCPSKKGKSGSDITLADFWGIEKILPSLDDDKGVSLLLVNSKKGINVTDNISSIISNVDFNTIFQYNSSWADSVNPHRKRDYFFQRLKKAKNVSFLIKETLYPTFIQKIRFKVYNFFYINRIWQKYA